MLSQFLWVAVVFILGSAFGSFVNVVVDRVYKGQSPLRARSYCDYCRKTLAWFDLIPVFSFIFLGGHCRFCHRPISLQYPIVEIATGGLFTAFAIWQLNFTQWQITPLLLVNFAFYFLTATALMIVLVSDLKYGLIYDAVVVTGTLLTVVYLMLTTPSLLGSSLLAAFLSFLLFLFLVLITKKRGMGEGDVKLVFWLGLLTGFPNFGVMLTLSFILGGLVAGVLLLAGKKKFGQTLPFGPFLTIATVLTLIWGEKFLNWYLASVR